MKGREGETETKDLDSPMTTQTDVSSSYDEQSLMTPSPMPSRLGRIRISSCSSSMNDNSTSTSDDIEDGDDTTSRTSSQRHRIMRRSIHRSQFEEGKNDDPSEVVLISALDQLHRLATLDSTEYQQRLLENTLPALQTEPHPNHHLYCPSLAESASTSTQIAKLSQPLQTPLVQLSMSIHRLHAAVANITAEVDGHTGEVSGLQSQLAILCRRNQQVEAAAKKCHRNNIKLRQQARHDRKVAHDLQRKVRQYQAQLESQGFQLMASKVQQHEIQLQLSKNQHSNSNSVENGRGRLRERVDSTMSGMSEYLDLEQELPNDNTSESVEQTATTEVEPKRVSGNEKHHIRSDSFVSIRSDLSERTLENEKTTGEGMVPSSSTSSVTSSKSNSVFSDTLPTLRFSAKGSFATHLSEQGSSSTSIMTTSTVNEVNPRESVSADATIKAPKKSTSFSNRFATFMGARTITNYNLKMILPCNIQFVEIPLNTSTNETKKEKRPLMASLGTADVVKDHGIVVQTNNSTAPASTRSLDDGLSPDSQKTPSVFAVCGLNGFNTEINSKPTVGAQLTKINGKPIDERWTLEILHGVLDKESGERSTSSTRVKPIVLTFRNELWDTAQTRVLNAAVRRVEGNGPCVGSAIHGIGNFLQNLNPSEGGTTTTS